MLSHLTLEHAPWFEPLVVLGAGTALIVALAALASRLAATAAWQRTIWQVSTLALLALALVEFTGVAPALVQLARANAGASPAQTMAAAPAPVQLHPSKAEDGAPATAAGSGRSGATIELPAPEQDIRVEQRGALPIAPGLVETDWTAPAMNRDPWSGDAGRGINHGAGHIIDNGPQRAAYPALDQDLRHGRRHDVDNDATFAARLESSANATLPSAPQRPAIPSAEPACAWWLALVWLLGAAVISLRTVWARVLLLLVRRRQSVVVEERLLRRVDALARRLGIRRPVVVMEGACLTAPVAFGPLRPTLVLPAGFSDDFDPRQQEAMLAHELAHLAARDPVWQFVAELTCAMLWWHPLSWWSRRRLRAASETAADDASLLVPGGPDVLAGCLVALGRRLTGASPRRLGWLSVEGQRFRSSLGRRVDRLLRCSTRSWRPPGRGAMAFARTALPVGLVIVAVFCTAWVRPQAALANGGTTMQVLKSSWRRSLAAAALAALLAPLSADAVSQERERDEAVPIPAEVRREREAGQREERDAPRREEREVGAREEREARQREQGEARRQRDPERRERAERREREPAEAPEREALARQIDVMRMAAPALREAEKPDALEVLERAIRAREVTLEGRRDDEAHMIRERAPGREQLAEILGMAARFWRELGDQDKAAALGRLADELARPGDRERPEVEHPDRPREPRPGPEVERRRRELRERAEQIERELRELGDGHDEEARELQGALREIHGELRRLEAGPRDPARAERAELVRHYQELAEAYRRAREADKPEEAEHAKRELMEVARQFGGRRLELPGPGMDPFAPPRPRGDVPPEVREQIEHLQGAVHDLNAQVRQMREQMEDMQRMLRRMAQREEDEARDKAPEREKDDD